MIPSAGHDLARIRERFFSHTHYHQLPGGAKKLDVLLALLLPRIDTADKVSVLDIGCGNGGLSLPVAELGFRVTGVDVDPESVEQSARANPFANAEFRLVEGDAFELGQRFDVVICSEVLEHLHEPGPLAATISRHLADDGVALITVPNGYGLREVLGRWEKAIRSRPAVNRFVDGFRRRLGMIPADEKCALYTSNPDQDHVQKFTIGGLKRLLASQGLEVIAGVSSFFIFSVFFKHGDNGHGRASLDSRVVDWLPYAMASGWYVVATNKDASDRVTRADEFRHRWRALHRR
jgi:SAM-dependent methyltransferase